MSIDREQFDAAELQSSVSESEDYGQETVYKQLLEDAEDAGGMYLPQEDVSVDMDTYVSRVVDIQFDEDVGAPYWQEIHQELKETYGDDFDIRDAVADEGYDAVREYLPVADEAALKERPMRDFVPDLYDPTDIDISKSSGTTGQKKLMPWSKAVSDAAVNWYDWNLEQRDVGDGDWLVCGPYGLYEKHLEGAVNERGGFCYFSGIETREVKKQLGALGELTEDPRDALANPRELPGKLKDAFKGVMRIQPTMTALEEDLQSESVEHIASAPGVVQQLYDTLEDDATGSSPDDIQTVLMSGTGVTDETVEDIAAQYENADIVPMYATSFTGPAFSESGDDTLAYHPMAPVVQFETVDPETDDLVAPGERGQVEINRIGPDFFWPNQRERETAVREAPVDDFDWNGIADIQPL